MLISTRGRYALRIMVDLARHQGEGHLALNEVARRQEISEKYLESIIRLLVKAGMLESLRGKGGGYRLSRLPGEYTVGELLRLTEESLAPVACLEPGSEVCPRRDHCATLPVWQGLEKVIGEYLDGITLEQLANQTAE